jgi:transcriptional regulator with XRE-family HTH domain
MFLLDVAERIKFYREQKGITVNKLATMAGISQSFLRELEFGNKKPTIETVSYICDALHITLRDFFEDGAASALLDNELIRQVYRLTPHQQNLLRDFLKAL